MAKVDLGYIITKIAARHHIKKVAFVYGIRNDVLLNFGQ